MNGIKIERAKNGTINRKSGKNGTRRVVFSVEIRAEKTEQ
jgi:hypothetical protein